MDQFNCVHHLHNFNIIRIIIQLKLKMNNKTVQSFPHFFEGTEKLLEVWFAKSDDNDDGCDLRKIPR